MKLSEKGLKRLYDEAVTFEHDGEVVCHPINQGAVVALQNFDFECKDFEDVVILTVDEAKAILRRIPEFKENGDWQLPINVLKKRIKQASGGK